MEDDQTAHYVVDEDTRRLLETVLELAAITSNLQLDLSQQQNVLDIVAQTASRFNVELACLQAIDVREITDTVNIDQFPFDITVTDKDKQ